METLDNEIKTVDPSKVSPRPAGMKWGLIGGAISIILGLFGYLTDSLEYSGNPKMGYAIFSFNVSLAVFCVTKAMEEHKAELGGYIRGGRCLTVGLWSGVFYGLLTAVWTIIFTNIIAPDLIEEMYAKAVISMEQQGLDDELIESSLAWSKMFQGPILSPVITLFVGIISGLILSIVPALFIKKKAPGIFE